MHDLADQPIGVFDSGIGGLSVLKALMAELPHERFVYVADSANAPYGERGDTFVSRRTLAIADYLTQRHHIKALVVACNTATAAAIHEARQLYPCMPVIGIEPALKPAVALTCTGRVGVIATTGTLASAKFATLMESMHGQADFVIQPCPGLAHAIEQSVELPYESGTSGKVHQLCQTNLQAMGPFGHGPGQIDTLVLGCTHYVFATPALLELLGPDIPLLSTGEPVARHTGRLLDSQGLRAEPRLHATLPLLLTNGALSALQSAANRWLGLPAQHCHIADGLTQDTAHKR